MVWKGVLMGYLLFSITGWCQGQTVTGKLAVNMTVQSSIGLVFQNNPGVGTAGFCPLTNAGTNNVGLDMGTASFTAGDNLACVFFFRNGTNYIVTSGFDVVVTEANSTSASYQLAAKIRTAPPANVLWFINLTQLTTAFTTFQNYYN